MSVRIPIVNDMSEPVVAIVVAAGSGVRLGGAVVKALRDLAGQTLVARSVASLASGGCSHAVVVIPQGLRDEFAAALAGAPIPVRLVYGGARRQDSVVNGLAVVESFAPGAQVVLVHDAARPLVPAPVTRSVIAAVRAGEDAVVPVIPVIDSVRALAATGSRVVDRDTLRAVQTPQGFRRSSLVAAHELIARRGLEVTDDAAACEQAGCRVALVEGSRDSLKITEPIDLLIAADVLARRGDPD